MFDPMLLFLIKCKLVKVIAFFRRLYILISIENCSQSLNNSEKFVSVEINSKMHLLLHVMCWYGFHIYLNEYISMHKSRRIMEIGVYNGENAVSMVRTAIKNHPPEQVEYYGFDFYYNYTLEYVAGKLETLGCKFKLIKGNTIDTVPLAGENLPKMDLILIDGGKSYREAWSDWLGSSKLMHSSTAVYVHNAEFSGVNQMLQNIPRESYKVEIFSARLEGKVGIIKKKE